jgi:MFS family permease
MKDDPHGYDISRLGAQVAVIAVVAVYGITNGFITPLLSLRLEEAGVSTDLIGLTVAVSAAGTLVVSPFVPRLMAAIGVTRIIALSLVMDALLVLTLPMFPGVWSWMAIRFVMGASVACLYIASEMWINELAQNRTRARVVGAYNAVLSVSFGIGPLVIVVTGTHGWAPFLVAFAIILCSGALLPLAARHAPTLSKNDDVAMLGIVREAPTLILAVLLVAILFGVGWGLLPVYGVRNGLGEEDAALWLSVVAAGGVLLQVPIGWLGDRFNRYGVLGGCALVSALIPPFIPMFLGLPWLLWAALFIWGGAFIAMYTMSMAIGGDRFRGTRLAMLMAIFGVMWGLGSTVGPLVGGWAMQVYGPDGLIGVLAISPVLWMVFAVIRQRTRQSEP